MLFFGKNFGNKKKANQQRISLQTLSQTSFASFVPNIFSLQQTFFVDFVLLQLVYFAIVNGEMVATTIGWDCASI
jgi:hypothetical protein